MSKQCKLGWRIYSAWFVKLLTFKLKWVVYLLIMFIHTLFFFNKRVEKDMLLQNLIHSLTMMMKKRMMTMRMRLMLNPNQNTNLRFHQLAIGIDCLILVMISNWLFVVKLTECWDLYLRMTKSNPTILNLFVYVV